MCLKRQIKEYIKATLTWYVLYIIIITEILTTLFIFSENIKYVFHLSTLEVDFFRALVNAHITDMHY